MTALNMDEHTSFLREARVRLKLLESRVGQLPDSKTDAIRLFYNLFERCPYSAFLKDADGTMLAKTDSYGENHGQGDEYLGQKDPAAWGPDVDFAALDSEAMDKGYAVGSERQYNPASGRVEMYHVGKWKWTLADGSEVEVGMVTANTPLPRKPLHA